MSVVYGEVAKYRLGNDDSTAYQYGDGTYEFNGENLAIEPPAIILEKDNAINETTLITDNYINRSVWKVLFNDE